jgi:hypothetical protein
MLACLITGGVFNTRGKENGGVGGEEEYIYSNSGDLDHILRFVG